MSVAVETNRALAAESGLVNLIGNNAAVMANFQSGANSAALITSQGILASQSSILSANTMAIAALQSCCNTQSTSTNNFSAEIASLRTVQAQNASSIVTETTRAVNSETALLQQIATISAQAAPTIAQSIAIANEITRATAAETALSREITGLAIPSNIITGQTNTAVGVSAMSSSSIGTSNTAMGSFALQGNRASNNTSIGCHSLFSNFTGSNNTAIGSSCLSANYASDNTAVGSNSLQFCGPGIQNTAVGTNALQQLRQFNSCTAIGWSAGMTCEGGSNNIFIGKGADVASAASTLTNCIVIGTDATISTSNTIQLGNSSISSLLCNVNLTATSDARLKMNIKANVPGLDFINRLRPVTYNDDMEARALIMKIGSRDLDREVRQSSVVKSGLLAQEVDNACQESGYDFDGLYKPKDDDDYFRICYTLLVVPLIQSVKDLSAQNDALIERVKILESKLA